MIIVKNITKFGEKMKKFVDYIMAQPVWKVLLCGLGILFIIFNPKIILPLLFFGGIGFAWYFAKKKPNATKRNIAAIASVLAVGGTYLINPNIASNKQEEQTQATHFASTPSKKDEKAEKETESKREKEAKEKAEKEKAEKEKKIKEEQERKEKEDRDKKMKEEQERKEKEEQERKEKEERDKKEAEAKQLAAQAEAAVQQLENNQIQDNVAPAQAAIANVADQGTKDRLTHRVGLVQNDINVRAQQAAEAERARQAAAAEQARQAAAAQQAQQQQVQNQTVSGGGYYRDASGRWHRPNGQFASKKEIANIGLAW